MEHQNGEVPNFMKKQSSVELLYFEEHERIDLAFTREIKFKDGEKKEALLKVKHEDLQRLSKKNMSLDAAE